MSGIVLSHKGVHPRIGRDVFIAGNAAVIGDVELGDEASIWFAATVRGDVAPIRVGARTNIQDSTVIHVNTGGPGTHIGRDVTVGHSAVLHECVLHDSCLIGMGACVMDGAVIESGAMVAARALVTPGKRVLSGQLWGGAPARHMRDLSEAEIADIVDSAVHYAELAATYLRGS